MKRRTLLLSGALGACFAMPAMGQTMVGQAHDFSGTGWAQGEICKPCHTPHNAIADENGDIYKLWNHTLTTATYTLHESAPSAAGPDDGAAAFDQASRLCMGCHDGTIALDAFGGNSGSVFITGGELIGTDLTDDHPVGRDAIYPDRPWMVTPVVGSRGPALGDGALRLKEMNVDGVQEFVVGCTTCHTPHYRGFDHQLNMTQNASAMCLACHVK